MPANKKPCTGQPVAGFLAFARRKKTVADFSNGFPDWFSRAGLFRPVPEQSF
jgi:hypothetical protein